MANSGGGMILIGVSDDGTLCSPFVDTVSILDSADITNRVFKYTGVHFSGFDVVPVQRDGQQRPALLVDAAEYPMVFTSPGTYQVEGPKQQQKTAFAVGTVYFRRGAKSEPAK